MVEKYTFGVEMRILINTLFVFFLSIHSSASQSVRNEKEYKTIHLYEHEYPVMLSCQIPQDGELIKGYDSYSIKLTEDLEIGEIYSYAKNDYDWVSKRHYIRSVDQMVNDLKDTIQQSKNWNKFKIIKEFENGIYAGETSVFGMSPYIAFFYETDEQVYELLCREIKPYTDEQLELILNFAKSVKPIPYCYDTVRLTTARDSVFDFTEIGYAFKMGLPIDAVVETENFSSYLEILLEEGKQIKMTQYSLPNEIEKLRAKNKEDIRESPQFIRFIYEDPTGYLAEMDMAIEGDYYHQYIASFFHKTDNYYYDFESYWWKYNGNKKLEPTSLNFAKETYQRIKAVVVGKICR